MRIVRYLSGGRPGLGVRGPDGVHPTGHGDLRALLQEAADPMAALRAALDRPPVEIDRLIAPLAERCQLISTGGNYRDHLEEVGLAPSEPVYFPKLWSAVLAPGDRLEPPRPESELDYEVELAFIVGRTVRNVGEADAMDHVFGYTVVNDVSAREVMKREMLQIMLCKSADGFLPVSEEIVTADEVDLSTMEISCEVNGEERQRAAVSAMIHPIPKLIAFLTRYVTLGPGDLVTTGTPAGSVIGRPALGFLKPGDVVTVSATGIAPARTVIGGH